jgi:hypothetical protein
VHLIDELATTKNLDLDARGDRMVLQELSLVANVVRHGDGTSCDVLRRHAPALWCGVEADDLAALEDLHRLSELVDVSDSDLRRYAMSAVRFWGLADPLPMAVIDPPIEGWRGQVWYLGRVVGIWVMVLISVSCGERTPPGRRGQVGRRQCAVAAIRSSIPQGAASYPAKCLLRAFAMRQVKA